MLIYHFGSREGLLAEVVGRIEAEQRAALAELTLTSTNLVEVSRLFWRRVADPALAPAERLFFEIYVQALYGRAWTESFRASVIAAWIAPIEEALVGTASRRRWPGGGPGSGWPPPAACCSTCSSPATARCSIRPPTTSPTSSPRPCDRVSL